MSDTTHRAFFGDAERDFTLAPALILELERVTGSGIGGLFNRLMTRDFRHIDLTETIRLGLIGGGATPEEAKALVDTYAIGRPILDTYPLAVGIFEALMFGTKREPSPESLA